MDIVVLLGSAKKDGDTRKVLEGLKEYIDFDLVDLSDYTIGHYDYEHLNNEDDFLPLIARLIDDYKVFVFATPVYWYAMSGFMKVFFDRITDLLDGNKEMGRKLRGKYMAVITSSEGDHLEENFWLPFKATASYLGIHYLTNLHTIRATRYEAELLEFSRLLQGYR